MLQSKTRISTHWVVTGRYQDENGKSHSIYYPTLLFLKERIELAKKLHCGISIWELGQGLDYFMDLLYFCLFLYHLANSDRNRVDIRKSMVISSISYSSQSLSYRNKQPIPY